MFRLIKASWSHPEIPEPPRFMATAATEWPPVGQAEPLQKEGESYPSFLDEIGLVGMGGSQFPAARKLEASKNVDTVVINAVECEPGITIDKSILLHHADLVRAGAEASASACAAKRIVIAFARNRELARKLKAIYPYDHLIMPHGYPGGAERLIVKKLTGRMLPAGKFPGQVGVLVQNVASLRAIGRALIDGVTVIERPLTVAAPKRGIHHDLIVPVGISVGDVVKLCNIGWDEKDEILIAGGLMMGKAVLAEELITKGTTSIMIMPKSALERTETICINCGACSVVCPLGLHPIGMVDPIRNCFQPLPNSVVTQVKECFLCGACATVCPAHIPLVKYIKEGKACVK
jgi:electron transport complex protein RnfC